MFKSYFTYIYSTSFKPPPNVFNKTDTVFVCDMK